MEPVAIGPRIRYYRQLRGMSQMELAERIGVSYQQIQKYERGRSQITVQRLSYVAEALRTTVPALLADQDASRASKGTVGYVSDRTAGAAEREQHAFLRLFARIENPRVRRHILTLMQSIVDGQSATQSPRPEGSSAKNG